jgi:hypothetical protein
MSARRAERKASLRFEIARLLVRLDHAASFIVDVNHGLALCATTFQDDSRPRHIFLPPCSPTGHASSTRRAYPFNRDFLSPRLRSETRQEPHPPNVNAAIDYFFSAGLPFNSTSTRSIGPFPTFSGRCAPAFSHIVWPALPAPSSLLPSG